MTPGLISIVVPVFQEEKVLKLLIERLDSVTSKVREFEWCYVLVNDGSTDDSWELIEKFSKDNPKVVGIDLSRNFGKEIALSAGVHYARNSEAVICIDADLQHPPELIPQMIASWRDGAEIVATIRLSNKSESFFRKAASQAYYWFVSRMFEFPMVSQSTDFRLYDHEVIKAFCRVTEHGRIFRGIMDWMGYRSVYLEFKADARKHGVSTYSYLKLIRLAVNSITYFSLWPLKIVGYLGVSITFLSGLLLTWMLIIEFFSDNVVYTPLAIVVVVNTLLIGIVLSAFGLIALYIGAIHTEVTNRPLYLVRDTIGLDNSISKGVSDAEHKT